MTLSKPANPIGVQPSSSMARLPSGVIPAVCVSLLLSFAALGFACRSVEGSSQADQAGVAIDELGVKLVEVTAQYRAALTETVLSVQTTTPRHFDAAAVQTAVRKAEQVLARQASDPAPGQSEATLAAARAALDSLAATWRHDANGEPARLTTPTRTPALTTLDHHLTAAAHFERSVFSLLDAAHEHRRQRYAQAWTDLRLSMALGATALTSMAIVFALLSLAKAQAARAWPARQNALDALIQALGREQIQLENYVNRHLGRPVSALDRESAGFDFVTRPQPPDKDR